MWLVLTYDLTDDYLERRGEFRDEHLAMCRSAEERGEMVLAGAFADPTNASMFVWSTDDREIVEAFVESDPYVLNGLVTGWRTRKWNVVVGGDGGS